ncbi:ImmA/IrrE family metallo-endopeptidase [Schleiferilactobacillus harbinensis]|uniref:Toxin n=1 Tax=Schleiferilactobacillus harbinensis TaxID=304207 RepID=A0A5P8M6I4_9LACO|nr:toxin [Schleiferilactobacillus harbinensis]QFR24118.1 toxin [Schleiferilactobacillus harbinensis]
MDDCEKLMAEYPQYIYLWKRDMPRGLSGLCIQNVILINTQKSHAKQHETLGEEIGHQITTYGDIVSDPTPLNRRCEMWARRWGYQKTITLDGLIDCWHDGVNCVYEAAEFFDVTENYVLTVLDYYRESRGEWFTYDGYQFDLSHGINITE